METAALNLSRLSWTGMYMDVYIPSTQLECIYHLQVEERRNTVHMRNNLVKCRKDVYRNGMITLHNELCCTYARLAVRWMRWRGALHRLPAHGTRRRLRGGALDAGHAAADRLPDNGPLAPVR